MATIYQGNFSGDYRPYVDGAIFQDSITRDRDNHISWDFNAALWVAESNAWWNYPWYLSWNLDGYEWLDVPVKRSTSGVISGQWYYMSSISPHFTGSKSVGGQQTYIPLYCWFHDNSGHWGPERVINVSIPRATAPGRVSVFATPTIDDNGEVTATISGSTISTGDYAHITKWRVEWGIGRFDENKRDFDAPGWDEKTHYWTITGLKDNTTYAYRVTVWNSAGYLAYSDGKFTTPEYISANVITDTSEDEASIWVVRPDGTKVRVVEVVRVEAS